MSDDKLAEAAELLAQQREQVVLKNADGQTIGVFVPIVPGSDADVDAEIEQLQREIRAELKACGDDFSSIPSRDVTDATYETVFGPILDAS